MDKQQDAIRVQGNSLAEALAEAAERLGVDQSRLRYETVERSKGFLSFLSPRRTEIDAWVVSAVMTSVASSRPVGMPADVEDADLSIPKRVLSQSEIEELRDDLGAFWTGICERMVGQPVHCTATLADGRLVLDADDEFLAQQIIRNSKLAEALENVIRKKPRHLKQELPFRVFVDARSQRTQREQELIQMAKEMSDKVCQSQRPIVLNNRCAYDRKIIHMALDQDKRVFTKSIGSGSGRKLMILPARDNEAVEQPTA